MPDYDAIVIGAGHNGLTAAAVMARGGLRVLCLEKNHFIGGMASTTELIRGYRFELAGSIQFPVPNEIFEELDLASCPIYEPEVQSASIGEDDQPPIFLYSDPERLLEHLGETLGIEAVLGMAEVAAWAEAPARAIGRFDVRRPPRSLDEMWACATNEAEREAIRMAMFGSVLDVVDRYLPTARSTRPSGACSASWRSIPPSAARPRRGARCASRSPWRPPARRRCRRCGAGSAPWPTTSARSSSGTAASCAGTPRPRGIVVEGGAVRGVELGDGEVATAPVVVSNLDPTATFTHLLDADSFPRPSRGGCRPSTTGPSTSRRTSRCGVCPSTADPTRPSTTASSVAT